MPKANQANKNNKQESIEATRQTADRDKPMAHNDEFQSIFRGEVPSIRLYYPTYVYAIDSVVKGPDLCVIYEPNSRFLNIADWHVKAKRTMFMTK